MTVTRKLARPLPTDEAEAALHRLMELPVAQVDPDQILAVAGCEEVLSEDLQHGQSFGRVRIVNPFRG